MAQVTHCVGEVGHCQVAFDDAMRLVNERVFWGQAAAAYASLDLPFEAAECRAMALQAERRIVAHANAALAGSFA